MPDSLGYDAPPTVEAVIADLTELNKAIERAEQELPDLRRADADAAQADDRDLAAAACSGREAAVLEVEERIKARKDSIARKERMVTVMHQRRALLAQEWHAAKARIQIPKMREAARECVQACIDGQAALALYAAAVRRYVAGADLARAAQKGGLALPFGGETILLGGRSHLLPEGPELSLRVRLPDEEKTIWGDYFSEGAAP